jgi:hypothetical protein
MSVAKAVRLGRRRSSRCSPAGATVAATARAHIRYKDAFTSTHDLGRAKGRRGCVIIAKLTVVFHNNLLMIFYSIHGLNYDGKNYFK